MTISTTTPPNWPASQDALKTKNGYSESANAFQDTTSPKENAFFATIGKLSIQSSKNVFQTVETTLITFLQQDDANVRKDTTQFWVNAEFVLKAKPTTLLWNVVWDKPSPAKPTKFTTLTQELVSVLLDTTESMESVLNALTVNTTMKLSGSADQDVELMRIIYN